MIDALKSQIKLLKSEITALEETVSRKDEEIAKLQSDLTQAQAKLDELDKKVTELTEQVTSLQSEVSSLTAQVSKLIEDLAEARSIITDLNSQITSLKEENSSLTKRLASEIVITYWASMFTTFRLKDVKITTTWPDEGYGLGVNTVDGISVWLLTKNASATKMDHMWFSQLYDYSQRSYVTFNAKQDTKVTTFVEDFTSAPYSQIPTWKISWNSGTRTHCFFPFERLSDGNITGYLFAIDGNFEFQTHDAAFVKTYTPSWLLGYSWS